MSTKLYKKWRDLTPEEQEERIDKIVEKIIRDNQRPKRKPKADNTKLPPIL